MRNKKFVISTLLILVLLLSIIGFQLTRNVHPAVSIDDKEISFLPINYKKVRTVTVNGFTNKSTTYGDIKRL